MDRSEEVRHDEAEKRFVVTQNGQTAYLSYAPKHGALALLHTEVPAEIEGRGVGSTLVRAAVDYARAQGMRVIPLCPFARAWIERHPEYKKDAQPA